MRSRETAYRFRLVAIYIVMAIVMCKTALSQKPGTMECRVGLYDADGSELDQATVRIKVIRSGVSLGPVSIYGHVHVFAGVPRDSIEISGERAGFEPQVFRMDLAQYFLSDTLAAMRMKLGRPGDAYEIENGRVYAYHPHPDLIAIALRVPIDSMRYLFDSLGLVLMGERIPGFYFLKKSGVFDRWNSPELALLRLHPAVAYAGPIRTFHKANLVGFSDEIIVTTLNRDDCEAGLEMLRKRIEFVNVKKWDAITIIAKVRPEIGEGIMDIAKDLSGSSLFETIRIRHIESVWR